MNKVLLLIASSALLLGGIGCQTKSLSVSPANSATTQPLQKGVTSGLPKTLLRITVVYTVDRKIRVVDGITHTDNPIVGVRKPVKIEPVYIADPNNLYVLTGAELFDSIWLDTSTKVTVGSNSMLSAVEADATDKGPEVASSLVSTALTIAKLAAAAGEFKGEPITTIETRLKEIRDHVKAEVEKLKTAADQTARDNISKKIQELLAERTLLLGIVKAYEDSSGQTETLTDVEYSITVDPSDKNAFKSLLNEPNFLQYTVDPPVEIFGPDCKAATPTVVNVKLYKTSAELAASNASVLTGKIDGIPYRPAVPVRVTVDIDAKIALDGFIPMSQYGAVAIAEAKYKPWAHMKTIAKFDPMTGGLIEYGVDASSSAEKAAKVLDESTTKLSSTLGEIQKAKTDASTAASAKPQADLTVQKNLLQAQFDLDKLQAEYDKWKKDNGIK